MYDKHMGHEFRNEIEMLRCIEHLNLVRFHGFLEFGGEQLIIVEYVPNGNLREHLEGNNHRILPVAPMCMTGAMVFANSVLPSLDVCRSEWKSPGVLCAVGNRDRCGPRYYVSSHLLW